MDGKRGPGWKVKAALSARSKMGQSARSRTGSYRALGMVEKRDWEGRKSIVE